MSRTNRQRRAEKKRRERGPRPQRDIPRACREPEPQPPTVEELAAALLELAHSHQAGQARSVWTQLAQLQHLAQEARLFAAVDVLLADAVKHAWRIGWLPADLIEIVRREAGGEDTVSVLLDAIADDVRQHAQATVHERWFEQVDQLDATVWWQPGSPRTRQWADVRGLDIGATLHRVFRLMDVVITLPRLPRILPLPGEATKPARAAGHVDQKILTRVRGLLAKAESTDFPEEADALSAKAQDLMNRHAFDRALLDRDQHRPQHAESIRLWLDAPYVDAKSHLVAAIAGANRCRSVFHKSLGFVSLVGDELDLEITELLTTSLLVQATRAMVAEGSQRSGTRSFRQSFLISYAARIGQRLEESGRTAVAEDPRLLPVLADRNQVVDETFNEMFSHVVRKSSTVSNGAGWHAGRRAADRADLTLERTAVTS